MANIKIDTDLTVEIGECHIEVELSTDRIMEEGHKMITIIEVTLEDEISEECKNYGGQNFRGGDRGNYKNEDFGCFKCRVHDHFVQDCPNSDTSKKSQKR